MDKEQDGGVETMPLAGVRVLELGRLIAAPLVGQMLADLGAEVIKVERPDGGDDFRRYGSVVIKDREGKPTTESAAYTSANRNKRSITVNLAHPDGQDVVTRLAKASDIFIENFMVGALAKFGLDYPSIRKLNPGIIYLSVTGYGQSGPYAHRPGTDSAFQALSGLMSITGEPDGEPTKSGNYAIDNSAGLYGAVAVLAALRLRDRTGEGQQIDLSLLECGIASLAQRTSEYLNGGAIPGRIGNRTPGTAPGQLFRCSDGYIAVQAGSDGLFRKFCAVIDRSDFLADPRYATMQLRYANIAPLIETLEGIFITRSSKQWFDDLSVAGLIAAPIYDVQQCFDDPHVKARGLRVTATHPLGASVNMVANPIRFSATPITGYRVAPTLSADTRDVLSRLLGYDDDRISQLRRSGAI